MVVWIIKDIDGNVLKHGSKSEGKQYWGTYKINRMLSYWPDFYPGAHTVTITYYGTEYDKKILKETGQWVVKREWTETLCEHTWKND